MTWKQKTILLAAAAVSGLVGFNGGDAATANPWIVFAGSPNHGIQAAQLFRVRASGSGLRQLTTGSRPADDAAFAVDARRVAFSRLSSGLFIVNVDGSGLHRLTGNGSDRYPVWSPNGRSIAFVRGAGSGYHLWLMGTNGQHQHRLRLAPALTAAERPAWTPDGKSLVIPSGGSFYRISAATGKVKKRLAPTYDVSLGQLLWSLSPNGRVIAYIGRRPEPAGCERTACEVFALYLEAVNAAQPKRSIDDAGVPGWSPDSRRLVYTHGGALNVESLSGRMSATIAIGDIALDGEAPPAWQPR